jgi:hypothetical protein
MTMAVTVTVTVVEAHVFFPGVTVVLVTCMNRVTVTAFTPKSRSRGIYFSNVWVDVVTTIMVESTQRWAGYGHGSRDIYFSNASWRNMNKQFNLGGATVTNCLLQRPQNFLLLFEKLLVSPKTEETCHSHGYSHVMSRYGISTVTVTVTLWNIHSHGYCHVMEYSQ